MRSPSGLRFDANLKWLFTELPFERRFDAAAAAGFTGVEYADPYPYQAADLRRRLRDAGLRQVLINSPAGPADSPERSGIACLPGRAAEFRAGVERGLAYATALDATFLHVLGGIRPPEVSQDRAFAQYVTNIGWAAGQAAGTGVHLLLEAQNSRDVPGYIVDSQERAAAVVSSVDTPHVELLVDLYHVRQSGGDVMSTLRQHLPRTGHLQLADTPARTEPGTGEIDWPDVFDTLRSLGYAGWLGCEYRPVADTRSGLSWIQELA